MVDLPFTPTYLDLRPTLFGVLAQLVTAGVTLPLYFIVHLRDIPLIPGGLAPDSVSRARTIFPAITVGFLLPSGILFLFPANAGLSLDTKQIIAAVWQPFPLYIGAALAISRVWDFISRRHLESGANDLLAKSKVAATRDEMAFAHLRRSYLASALLSTIAHWAIVIPSLVTTKTSLSFAQIFIPYSLHSYFSVAPSPLAAYRLSIRLLFQNDWFTMTVAALVFFGWIHVELDKALPSGEQTGLFRWLAKVTFLTMLGGPGAAIAWAAVSREGYMMALSQRARDRTLEVRGPLVFRMLSKIRKCLPVDYRPEFQNNITRVHRRRKQSLLVRESTARRERLSTKNLLCVRILRSTTPEVPHMSCPKRKCLSPRPRVISSECVVGLSINNGIESLKG